MGGSHDFFSDSPEDDFDMIDLHDRIAQVNQALKSGTVLMVSSLTQAEFIYWNIIYWCVDINIRKSLGRVYESSDKYLPWSEKNYGLALSQLVVGRFQLVDRSVSAFLEQCKHLPRTDWSIHEISRLTLIVKSIRCHTSKHQKRVNRSMEELSGRWKEALEEGVKPLRRTIESAFEQFIREREVPRIDLPLEVMVLLRQLPIPENVPSEFLLLAARYNKVRYRMFDDTCSKRLHKIFKNAAVCSSGGGGPSRNAVMNERIGVNSVTARDHGSSSGHFQGLSLDTSRTMTEHGQASSRRNRQRRGPSSRDRLE
ncbi:hypothetical protein SeLEV6574_g02248 [Synchytrium endobioticum]|uniref:Uncharacterized protein n=1 Tax=Synchytrium endobioticum TaxID=286115 RepID=A0A507D950_9FUNG|nr:hypothetical protein SeLEV6574_g02248 [Synchytrium endobioticum]